MKSLKIFTLALLVCGILVTSMPLATFAANEVNVTIPNLPELPNVLAMLGESAPPAAEENYDFIVDTTEPYTIRQNGTYLVKNVDNLAIQDGICAYLGVQDTSITYVSCAANTNVEFHALQNVSFGGTAFGNEKLYLRFNTCKNIVFSTEETAEIDFKMPLYGTDASALWFLGNIVVSVTAPTTSGWAKDDWPEWDMISGFSSVSFYNSTASLKPKISYCKKVSGDIRTDNLYLNNSQLDYSIDGYSEEATDYLVVTNDIVMKDSTFNLKNPYIQMTAKNCYVDTSKLTVWSAMRLNALMCKNAQLYFRDSVTAQKIHLQSSPTNAFVKDGDLLFYTSELRVSEDTIINYWSGVKKSTVPKNVIASDALDVNTSVFSPDDFFTTNLSYNHYPTDGKFDNVFVCDNGIFLIPFPGEQLNENVNFDDGFFATNDPRLHNTAFYIFQVLDAMALVEATKNFDAEHGKNVVAVAFGYSTLEDALLHLEDVCSQVGCTKEDFFYQSVAECLEKLMQYDGVTFTSSDCVAACRKSAEEIKNTYLNTGDKVNNVTEWKSGKSTYYYNEGSLVNRYLEMLYFVEQVCTNDAYTDFYTLEGFKRYLYLQNLLSLGGVRYSFKDYGGAKEYETFGITPLSYNDGSGVYQMKFTYGQHYADTQKVRSLAVGQRGYTSNYRRAMYYLPEGGTLKTDGVAIRNFPGGFDLQDVLQHAPKDKVVTGYKYNILDESGTQKTTENIEDFVFAEEDLFEQLINFTTEGKYCTLRYDTNGLGTIRRANQSDEQTYDTLDSLVPYGYSPVYAENNELSLPGLAPDGHQNRTDGQTLVHSTWNQAASVGNGYYFEPSDNTKKISGWLDANGNPYDFSTPMTTDAYVTLTPVLVDKGSVTGTMTVRIATEDNSTEDFAYAFTQPMDKPPVSALQLVDIGSGVIVANYTGNSTSVYIPYSGYNMAYALGRRFPGTETNGMTEFTDFPDLEAVNPIQRLKVENGYDAVGVYANSESFSAYLPSSVNQFIMFDARRQEITPAQCTIYYSYGGNCKTMILDDISSNRLTAEEVAKKYCHFCDDDLNPLSATAQTQTLAQLLSDAGLSPVGIVPLELLTPHTDENDWAVNPNDATEIIEYTGADYAYIGIPAVINGVEIKKVRATALPGRINVTGYYVPATITNITAGYLDAMRSMDSTYSGSVIGTDDMSIFSTLSNAYVVVDEQNPNYSSYKGSLYNKQKDYLYYLGGGTDKTTVLPSVKAFSAFALGANSTMPYPAGNPVNKMTFLGTEPVRFNEVTIAEDTFSMYFGGFIITDSASGEKAISPINFVCAENSPFHNAWLTQVQQWLDSQGITDTTAQEGAEFFLTLVDPNTYEDPNLSDSFTIQEDTGDTTKGYININSPFQKQMHTTDNTDYVFELIGSLPERYITPTVTEYVLNPSVAMEDITIHLRLKRGTLNITTMNVVGDAPIQGVVYEIENTETGEVYTTEASDAAGQVVFDDLIYGNYTVVQKSCPSGWKLNTEIKTFSVTEDGQVISLTFTNERATLYSVRIPKTIVLDGNTGHCAYSVGVKGILAEGQAVTITPEATFLLNQDGKDAVVASVLQNKTSWIGADLSEGAWAITAGTVDATLTAGVWKGIWQFTISIGLV